METEPVEVKQTDINNTEVSTIDPNITQKLCPEPVLDVEERTEKLTNFTEKTYWFPEKRLEEGDSLKTGILKYPKLKAIVDAPNETMSSLMCTMKDLASKAFDHASVAATSAVSLIQAQSAKALDHFNGYLEKNRDNQPPKER